MEGINIMEETKITKLNTEEIHMTEKYDREEYMHAVLDRTTGMVAEMDTEAWWNIYYEKFLRYVRAAEVSADDAYRAETAMHVAEWVRSLESFSDNVAEDYAIGRILADVINWIQRMRLPDDMLLDVYKELLDFDIDVDSDDY